MTGPDEVELQRREVEALTLRELGTLVRFVQPIRYVAVLVLAVLAVTVWLIEPIAWRVGLLSGAALVLGFVAVAEHLADRRGATVGPVRLISMILYVVTLHTTVIVATGGLASPLVVLFLPVAVISGVTLKHPKYFLPVVLTLVALVMAMAAMATVLPSPEVSPSFAYPSTAAGLSHGFRWSYATVLAIVLLVGSGIGSVLRRSLDRVIVTAAFARQEAVTFMRERNQELVELSGALAHELKNPLASIQGLAGLLRRRLPAESREAEQMGVLLGEVRRMGAVLDEFLNFSRPAQGLAVRPVDADGVVRDVVMLHEGSAAACGVTLIGGGSSEAPIRCDPRKIKQVLVNLIQNALDATPAGGWVRVTVESPMDGTTAFVVEDTGAGLAPEVRGRLFTPGTTTKVAGSGLGLTIARAIVEQHGGTLTIEDRQPRGCRAIARIPTAPEGDAR